MSSDPPTRDPSPAELFERFFGPSLFIPWSRVLIEHAPPRPDDRVLDLACATGIMAREVSTELEGGSVTGVDLDPAMLEVARKEAREEGVRIEWREGDAQDLDLPDDTFDLVYCQQGLQFFSGPVDALREARRVLKPGGRVALNVWQPLPRHPVYSQLLRAEADHLGADLADVARPFMFGDDARLRGVFTEAGFESVEVTERTLEVEFQDPESFVQLTIMAGAAVVPELAPEHPQERDELIGAVSRRSADVLERHRDGGRLRFPMPNYLAVGRA